ncbi:MAG: NnrU family protein [Hyphomicrobiaceae bacterium]
MVTLILGLLVFLGIHALPMNPGLRAGLIERFGENAYKGAFSLISAIGFILIILGYGKLQVLAGKNPQIWVPPTWTTHLALALMMISMVLLVAAYVPSNIKRIVGHPMLAAIKVWALAHLLANGDLASILLFGSFLAYAVIDRISVKKREAVASATAPSGSLAGDGIVVVGGLALYAAFAFFLHEWLIGVAPVPGIGA